MHHFKKYCDLFGFSGSQKKHILLIVLYAWLKEQNDQDEHKKTLLSSRNLSKSFENITLNNVWDSTSNEDINYAFRILNSITLKSIDTFELLSVFDEIFFMGQKNKLPRVPRWLSDLLIKLSDISHEAQVLDLCSSYGNIITAALINKSWESSRIKSLDVDIDSMLWSQIQSEVLNKGREVENSLYNFAQFNYDLYTNIISAPPFGFKDTNTNDYYYNNFYSTRFEDLCLEFAIKSIRRNGRIVIIVPESLLVSEDRKNIRSIILRNIKIKAILSLPKGTFLPFANVKTSILILENITGTDDDDVFLSELKDVALTDTFNSYELPEIKNILENFLNWSRNKKIDTSPNYWLTPANTMNESNLSVKRYKQKKDANIQDDQFPFEMVPLEDLCFRIDRGTRIKIDEKGDVRFIGPASIRPMKVDHFQFNLTSLDNIPKRITSVQKGDILFNNIGTYLGSTALADETIAGKFISQHLILIRPELSKVLPEYLTAAINSEQVKLQIKNSTTGIVMSSLSLSALKKINIPLPDLKTQKKIADNLKKAQDEYYQMNELLKKSEARYSHLLLRLFDEEVWQ